MKKIIFYIFVSMNTIFNAMHNEATDGLKNALKLESVVNRNAAMFLRYQIICENAQSQTKELLTLQ